MKTFFLSIVLLALVALATASVGHAPIPRYCHLRADKGHCHQHIPQWWYNSKTQTCQLFTYSGCGGNRNRFSSKAECERTCKPKVNICKLPADSGPCEALTYRWYFNHASGQCEQFQYGGCQGNANNFVTKKDCQDACRKDCSPRLCLVAPCAHKTCPAYPGAKCVVDTCKGCNFFFVDKLGKVIKNCDDCGKRGDQCDNQEYYDKFPGQHPVLKPCCEGFQCCACGPHVQPHGYIPPQFGKCQRRCRCFKG